MMRGWLPGRDTRLGLLSGLGALVAVVTPAVLLADIALDGLRHLSPAFFTHFASRFPERAGIRAPLIGTIWLFGLTAVFSIPVSVGAAIYLEEYAPKRRLVGAIRILIDGLAGVPSVVYGLLGLAIFVRALGMGRSVLVGSLTLSLLIMPLIILSTQEALRRIPMGLREAAYGLGATRWQVVRYQVLPLAIPEIVSGGILALSRAVGETAPLVVLGAVTFIAFTPEAATDPLTALPVQIFHWTTRPREEFKALAAAAIIVLLAVLFAMNVLAAVLRQRPGRRIREGTDRA